MEGFSCCSLYIQCSDQLQCLHKDNPEYEGCRYRINLENGRVFYGKNARKIIQMEKKPAEMISEIYLSCYQQFFKVLSRNKNTYSYRLNQDQAQMLADVFIERGIPFRTKINLLDDPEGDYVEIDAPANSRAVFQLNGEEFNILAFNSYMIKNYFAEKISKALTIKGFTSRVELVGSHTREESTIVSITKQSAIKIDSPRPAAHSVQSSYTQISLFDSIDSRTA